MRLSNRRAAALPLAPAPVLGLAANWRQFTLLVIVNAFVGGMVGLERSVLPLLAEQEFGLASRTAILSFIASFGLVKALTNLLAGWLSDRIGRKRLLVAGWLFGIPVPLLIMLAPSWGWIVAANVLLGLNQGLCWSMTIVMKIDLVGPVRRGLAMGLNEAAGWLAVSLAALAAGYLATAYALRPQPFYLGLVFALAGLLLSLFWVRETQHYSQVEAQRGQTAAAPPGTSAPAQPGWRAMLLLASSPRQPLFVINQAGLINNLNDGMAWGLFPLYFALAGLSLAQISVLAALYPAVWGLAQLGTGALSDRLGRKWLIAWGMALQGASILLLLAWNSIEIWSLSMALLGLGTAMVYPTLLAAIGDLAHPAWRASAVGIYRLWRDSGYALGALLSGLVSDLLGLHWAIALVGALTLGSAALVAGAMQETLPPEPAP